MSFYASFYTKIDREEEITCFRLKKDEVNSFFDLAGREVTKEQLVPLLEDFQKKDINDYRINLFLMVMVLLRCTKEKVYCRIE